MPLSPVDFQAYSAATGAPYPETPDEKAAAYPAVAAWKAQHLAARQEDRGPSATSLLLGGAGVLGLGAGGYALYKHLTDRGVRPGAAAAAAATATTPSAPAAPASVPASAPAPTAAPAPEARVTGRNPTTGTRGPDPVRVQRSKQAPHFAQTAEAGGTRLYPDIANFSPLAADRDKAGGLAAAMRENRPNTPLTDPALDGVAEARLNPSRFAQQKVIDALPPDRRREAAAVLSLANNGARVPMGRAFPENPQPNAFFRLLPTKRGEASGDAQGRRPGTYQFVTRRNGTADWVGVEGDDIARALASSPVEAYGGVTQQEINAGQAEPAVGSRHTDRWRSDPRNFGDSVLLDRDTGKPLVTDGGKLVPYRPDDPKFRAAWGSQSWSDIGETSPHLQKDYVNDKADPSPGAGLDEYFKRLPASRSRPFVQQPAGRGAYGWQRVVPSQGPLPAFDPSKPLSAMLTAEQMKSARSAGYATTTGVIAGPNGPQRVEIPVSPGVFYEELPPTPGDEGYYGTTASEVADRGTSSFHNYTNTDRDVTLITGPDGQPLMKRGPSGALEPMTRGPSIRQRPQDLAELGGSGAFAAAGRLLDYLGDLRSQGVNVTPRVERQAAIDLARTHNTGVDQILNAAGAIIQRRARQQAGAGDSEPSALTALQLRPQAERGAIPAATALLERVEAQRARGERVPFEMAQQWAQGLAQQHGVSEGDVIDAVAVLRNRPTRAPHQNPTARATTYNSQVSGDPLSQFFDAAGGARRAADFDLYPMLLSDNPDVRARAAYSWLPELGRSVKDLQGKVGLKALTTEEQVSLVGTALTMAARDYKTAIDVAARTPGMEAIAAQAAPGQQNAITFDQFARPYVRRATMGMVLQATNGGPTSPSRYTVPKDVAELMAHDAALSGRDLHVELQNATADASSPFDAVLKLDDRVSAAVGGGNENYTAGSRLAEWFLKEGYQAAPDSQAAQLHQTLAQRSEGGGFRFPVTLNFGSGIDDSQLNRPTAAEAEEVIQARLADPTRSALPVDAETPWHEAGDPWKDPAYSDFAKGVGNPELRTRPINGILLNQYRENRARMSRQNAAFNEAKQQFLDPQDLARIQAETQVARASAKAEIEKLFERQRQLDARNTQREIEVNRLNTSASIPGRRIDPFTGRTVDTVYNLGSGWVLDDNGAGGVGVLPNLLVQGRSLDEDGASPGLEHDGVIALDRQQDLALERGATPLQASTDAAFDPQATVLDAADTDQARARAEKFVADRVSDPASIYRATSIPLKSYGRMTIDQATPLADQLAEAQRSNIELKRQRVDRDLALFEQFGDGPVRWRSTVPEQDVTFRRHPANPVPGVGLSIARNQWAFNPETGQQEVVGVAQNPVDRGPVWSTADTRGMGGIARSYPNTNWSGDLPTPGADYSASFGPRSSANEYAGMHGYTLEDDGRRVMQPPPDRATEWVTTRLARPTQAQSVLVGPGPVVGTVERTDDGHSVLVRMVGSNASDPIRAITGPEAAGLYYDLAPREDVPSGTSDFRWPTPIATGAPSSFDRDVTIPTGLPADQIAARAAFDAARQRGDTWQEGTLRGGPGDLSGEIGGGLGRRGSSMPVPERGFTGLPGSARPARTLTPEESARLWAQRHLRRR